MTPPLKPCSFVSRVFLGFSLVLLAGCGGDPFDRQPVQGSIQFGGKAIKYGSIRFEPAEKQPTGGSASIRDGKYQIDRVAGISPGKYKVWVQAFDKSGELAPGAAPGSEGAPPKDILPPRYLNEPAGECTISRVKDDKPNEFNLDLK